MTAQARRIPRAQAHSDAEQELRTDLAACYRRGLVAPFRLGRRRLHASLGADPRARSIISSSIPTA